MKNFAEKLREIRIERGYTQNEVAKELGLTKNAITNYEAGTREPSMEVLKKLCRLFRVSADYFLDL